MRTGEVIDPTTISDGICGEYINWAREFSDYPFDPYFDSLTPEAERFADQPTYATAICQATGGFRCTLAENKLPIERVT